MICVDLDGGVIAVPECVTIPRIPDPYYTCAVEALTKVSNIIRVCRDYLWWMGFRCSIISNLDEVL